MAVIGRFWKLFQAAELKNTDMEILKAFTTHLVFGDETQIVSMLLLGALHILGTNGLFVSTNSA